MYSIYSKYIDYIMYRCITCNMMYIFTVFFMVNFKPQLYQIPCPNGGGPFYGRS